MLKFEQTYRPFNLSFHSLFRVGFSNNCTLKLHEERRSVNSFIIKKIKLIKTVKVTYMRGNCINMDTGGNNYLQINYPNLQIMCKKLTIIQTVKQI